ncbi:MAG TPA: sigma-70 family RNA polymerase sigma factor [Nitrolancea sp.]|nr:sigma-70 family RNA polymerase sigma factor [Nitrolancea sp.]
MIGSDIRTTQDVPPDETHRSTRSDGETESAEFEAARTDPSAFAALYQRHLPPIYRYLLARTTSPEEAADLSQQVFLKALEALPRYRVGSIPISAWLFRIARNLSIDLARRHRRHPTIPLEHLSALLLPIEPNQPEEAALRSDAGHRLMSLLDQLDDEKRELILLRFVAGLKTSEIGRITGKSDAAVRKRLLRTIALLRERYDAE